MNNYQEALNNLCGCDAAYYQGDKDVETLQELVNKETPIKPIENHYEEKGQEPYIKYTCPRCEQLNNKRYSLCSLHRYCPICGQKLDWSDK
ncbi:MAG: hypothetical protein NC310_00440 [Roseburia sp.]|nr:hypothetical protein [Anaeroplasma bactoclasticum]MCM1195520.1 hypothetical protein [Roseburia sp.]MCM1556896.1 hypothetical protein [Anaeroplasma bactoclasticum]